MSRWTTFALSTVSVLALTAVTAPATGVTDDSAPLTGRQETVKDLGKMKDTGNWCC